MFSQYLLNEELNWEERQEAGSDIQSSPDYSCFCCCSVAKLCPTLCDPKDCSTTGLPVLHHLLDSAQTHVHWVSDVIQPSHPLSPPSPPAFNLSQHHDLFQWVGTSHQVDTKFGASISASILTMNIQGWFPLGLPGLISLLFKGHSTVFSSSSLKAVSLLYGPALTSVHDYWKNHSFDYTNFCLAILTLRIWLQVTPTCTQEERRMKICGEQHLII